MPHLRKSLPLHARLTESVLMHRMLSNRESARRSRRRKQEHLSSLEDEVQLVLQLCSFTPSLPAQ